MIENSSDGKIVKTQKRMEGHPQITPITQIMLTD